MYGPVEPHDMEQSPPGDAVAALGSAAATITRFLGVDGGVDRHATTAWEYIVLITGGRLLRPRRQLTG